MKDQTQNILVIEDNQDVLESILSILEYSGYNSEGLAHLSDEAFEQLKSEPFGLIILDVMLSGADGRDLARRFKDTKETRGMPILMVSAYPEIESSVTEAGADDFLPKPFGIDELMQKVEQFMDDST